jgi:hypothetical protein
MMDKRITIIVLMTDLFLKNNKYNINIKNINEKPRDTKNVPLNKINSLKENNKRDIIALDLSSNNFFIIINEMIIIIIYKIIGKKNKPFGEDSPVAWINVNSSI